MGQHRILSNEKGVDVANLIGAALARALRTMPRHDEALVLFEESFRMRLGIHGTDESREASSGTDGLHAALSRAFGLLPTLRWTVQEANRVVLPDFFNRLEAALEDLSDDWADIYGSHLQFKKVAVDDAHSVAAALRGSFYHYAEQADCLEPL